MIVDSSPILPVADALIIAQQADARALLDLPRREPQDQGLRRAPTGSSAWACRSWGPS